MENKALKVENAALREKKSEPAGKTASKPDKIAASQKIVEFAKLENFVVGAVGRFSGVVRIEQVLGSAEMVVSKNVQTGLGIAAGRSVIPVEKGGNVIIDKRWRFLIRGLSTAGLVDEMERKLDTVFVVQGTHTAELANGGTETLFVLVPYVPDAAAPKPGS